MLMTENICRLTDLVTDFTKACLYYKMLIKWVLYLCVSEGSVESVISVWVNVPCRRFTACKRTLRAR
jgi:hypothetical protein